MARRLPCIRFYTFSLLMIWAVVNAAIFWNTYKMYKGKPEHFYLRSILGRGLCISRGTGSVLNVSCCLILLPVCKWTSTALRKSLAKVSRNLVRIFIDAAKNIHVTCAVTVFAASVVHTAAHVVNAINFSRHYQYLWTDINMATYPGQDPVEMVLTTLPGITGLLMMLLILAIFITSLRCCRSSHYNIFYYTHFAFLPFLLLLVIHPMSGVLKEQVNWKDHIPGCVWNTSLSTTTPTTTTTTTAANQTTATTYCPTEPVFTSMKTYTWIWVTVPLIVYVMDMLVRTVSRSEPSTIVGSKVHPGNILELRIAKSFKCKPGQYVLLQCPRISTFEWHPFSLTSCPDVTHPYWSVHVNTKGDWCSRLLELAASPATSSTTSLYVDGPYGSPMCDLLQSRFAVCVAGGIGITPFIASLQHLMQKERLDFET